MDFNEYFAECLLKERLAEARELAARNALIDSLRLPRRPMRVALGLALIRVGQWILGRVPEYATEPDRLA